MKVWDIFPFFNESMVADIRMRHLRADLTVVIEANQTFSGIPKGINFPRIGEEGTIHVMAKGFSKCKTAWEKEEYQENSALAVIEKWMKDEDLVICSDVDEIPRREIIEQLKGKLGNKYPAVRLGMNHHKYRFNLFDPSTPWVKAGVCTGKAFKDRNFTGIRNWNESPIIENSGWHLYGMGTDLDFVVKAKATSHFNDQATIDMIERIEGGASLMEEEKDRLVSTDDFPPECTAYPHLFSP